MELEGQCWRGLEITPFTPLQLLRKARAVTTHPVSRFPGVLLSWHLFLVIIASITTCLPATLCMDSSGYIVQQDRVGIRDRQAIEAVQNQPYRIGQNDKKRVIEACTSW